MLFKSLLKTIKKDSLLESSSTTDNNYSFGLFGSDIENKSNQIKLRKDDDTISNLLLNKKNNLQGNKKGDNALTDGYWVTIQKWTQCSLACGGGKSYLQRLCVPPKAGGKACQGEPILTRDCNKQKCPTVISSNNISSPGAVVNNNAKAKSFVVMQNIKAIGFAAGNKPMRYDKCHLKEDNLFVFEHNNRSEIIPARVIMNENSISAFKGDNYDSNIISFNLKETVIAKDEKDNKCFVLANNLKKYVFCAYITSSARNFIEEWIYDFNLFKFQCAYKKQIKQNKQLNKKESISSTSLNYNNYSKKEYKDDFLTVEDKQSLFLFPHFYF